MKITLETPMNKEIIFDKERLKSEYDKLMKEHKCFECVHSSSYPLDPCPYCDGNYSAFKRVKDNKD